MAVPKTMTEKTVKQILYVPNLRAIWFDIDDPKKMDWEFCILGLIQCVEKDMMTKEKGWEYQTVEPLEWDPDMNSFETITNSTNFAGLMIGETKLGKFIRLNDLSDWKTEINAFFNRRKSKGK